MALSELGGSLGIQITLFVIPLLAITEFDATPLQLGTLNLLDSAAALCFGLAIGTAIDRMGGFVAVLVSDLLRFGTVAVLAIFVMFGPQLVSLYIAMFLVGAASLMREAGTSAAVAELGLRSTASLNRMNALLRGGSVVSETSGPGVAGFLVVALGFSLSLVGGAVGFAIAAVCALTALRLRTARVRSNVERALVEVGAAPQLDPPSLAEPDAADLSLAEEKGRGGFGSGLRYIWSHPVLRPLVLSSVQFNFFTAALQAVLLYYCVHVLALSPGDIAVAGVSAGIGGLIGSALAATPMVSRHQKAWYLTSLTVPAVSIAIIIAAQTQPASASLAMLCVAEFLWSVAIVLCVVLFNTLRQISSPDRLVGQVAASERVLAVGGEVPGAVLGGIVGTFVSLDLTMLAALGGIALSSLWALRVRDWSATGSDAVGGRP